MITPDIQPIPGNSSSRLHNPRTPSFWNTALPTCSPLFLAIPFSFPPPISSTLLVSTTSNSFVTYAAALPVATAGIHARSKIPILTGSPPLQQDSWQTLQRGKNCSAVKSRSRAASGA